MSYEESSPEEEKSESPSEAQAEGDTQETSAVTPEFQKECESIVDNATIPELDYVISKATDLKKKMIKSQGKAKLSTDSFSTEGMPS